MCMCVCARASINFDVGVSLSLRHRFLIFALLVVAYDFHFITSTIPRDLQDLSFFVCLGSKSTLANYEATDFLTWVLYVHTVLDVSYLWYLLFFFMFIRSLFISFRALQFYISYVISYSNLILGIENFFNSSSTFRSNRWMILMNKHYYFLYYRLLY